MRRFATLLYILVFASALSLAYFTRPGSSVTKSDTNEKLWVTPPPYLEYFTFGYREILADLLWLRVIQDFDVCNHPTPTKYDTAPKVFSGEAVESAANEATRDIMERLNRGEVARKKNCDLSWPYFMMDAATNLSPQFQIIYVVGGSTLSVLIEDWEGATRLFNKGVQNVKYWSLYYRAAYHFLYDRKDYNRAAQLLNESADLGAPHWVRSLASRLYTLTGQAELAISVLSRQLEEVKNPGAIEDIQRRLKVLKQIVEEERLKKSQSKPK